MYFPSFNFWRSAAPLPVLATAAYNNITVSGNLYIVNGDTNYQAPSGGWVNRSAVLAGLTEKVGTFPGPTINGYKGDTFELNVINRLTDDTMLRETTIHWHGIEQPRTAWADGVAFVTQCPFIPGDSFPYRFPVLHQAGTFWYHSHYSAQYCDGLRGAFIIRDRQDPYLPEYDVDDDSTVLTLSDWYQKKSTQGRSTWDLTLINGAVEPIITVQKGRRYRFRMINTSCDSPYNFHIEGHNLIVIEVEGVLIQRYTVGKIPILAGQRYSFILDTRLMDDRRNYWVHAIHPTNRGPAGRGILHYTNAGNAPPIPVPGPGILLNETFIRPYYAEPAPGGHSPTAPDVYNVNLEMGRTDEGFTINGVRFRPPSRDVLLQILSGTVDPHKILPPGSVISLPRDRNIQITYINADTTPGAPHPMHLHGHTFSVVRSIGAYNYTWDNPPRRDTVSTSLFGLGNGVNVDQVTIRFKTDNPGPWILHCHIDWHLEEGLAIVFAEDITGIKAWQQNIPDRWYGGCQKYWDWLSHGQ